MKTTALMAALLALSSGAWAASTAYEAMQERNQAIKDGQKALGAFLAGAFQKSAGFTAGSQAFSPAGAKKLLRFNLGVMGGLTAMPIDKTGALNRLDPNKAAQLRQQIEGFPAVLPIPQAGLDAHLGLPSFLFFQSMDLGLRLSGFNQASGPFSAELGGMGLDLRGNLFEAGLVWPLTLALGLSVDNFQGKVAISQRMTMSDTSTVPGYTASGDVTQLAEFTMNNTAYALKAVASRKFFFVTPYAGLSAQVNSGGAESRFAQTGTVTVSSSPVDTYTSSETVEVKVGAPVDALDIRLGAGLEISLGFFYLTLGGEYGAVSGGSGGHLRSGFQF